MAPGLAGADLDGDASFGGNAEYLVHPDQGFGGDFGRHIDGGCLLCVRSARSTSDRGHDKCD